MHVLVHECMFSPLKIRNYTAHHFIVQFFLFNNISWTSVCQLIKIYALFSGKLFLYGTIIYALLLDTNSGISVTDNVKIHTHIFKHSFLRVAHIKSTLLKCFQNLNCSQKVCQMYSPIPFPFHLHIEYSKC
jgi:hypothetical protein